MQYGDLKTGRIDVVGDSDVFNFNGRQGEAVSIGISRTAGSGTPCWHLLDPNGSVVTGWVCNSIGNVTLNVNGKYSLEVLEASSDQTVDYRLSLQRVGVP
jgi:hypothetical protein